MLTKIRINFASWRNVALLAGLTAFVAACDLGGAESTPAGTGDAGQSELGDTVSTVADQPALPPANVLTFTTDGNGVAFLGTGWSAPEQNFTWSVDNSSQIVIPEGSLSEVLASQEGEGSWQLNLMMWAFVSEGHPSQSVDIYANDSLVGTVDFAFDAGGGSQQLYTVDLGETWSPGEALTLTFEIDDPRSPAEVMDSPDDRRLGIALASVSFDRNAGE